MKKNQAIFEHFSNLLSYPEPEKLKHGTLLLHEVSDVSAENQKIANFCEYIITTNLTDIEELFTRTFDMNPACCLEVGWHLYGEDYQRGQFLVKMRQSLEDEKIPESVELPDHLSHCLLLLTRLDEEDGFEFSKSYLLPAIKKILTDLDENNPYRDIIDLLQTILQDRYKIQDDTNPLRLIDAKSLVMEQ